MSNEPINVTDAAFEKTVLQSSIPVIVDFWAPGCGPCKMVAPILDKLAREYEGKVLIAKVNTDDNPEWMMKYGIQGIPTMLFVSGGKIVHRQVGALPERGWLAPRRALLDDHGGPLAGLGLVVACGGDRFGRRVLRADHLAVGLGLAGRAG